MFAALITLLFTLNTSLDPDLVQCDTLDGVKVAEARTREAKRDTRRRIQRVCKALRMSADMCVYMDVVVCRESWCGVTTARHVRGPGEHGLGAMALSLRWHRNKWPTPDFDPLACVPEVTGAVAAAIIWAAGHRFGAQTLVEVQAIYAGRFFRDPETGKVGPRHEAGRMKAICRRLERRGVECLRPLKRSEFGRRVRTKDRRRFVERLLSTD